MKVNSQLERAQLENLTSLPAAATAGRVAWDTVAGKTFLDDGTDWRAFLRNDQTAIIGNNGTAANNIRFHRGAAGVLQFVSGADATAEGTLSTAINQISARVENYATGSLPANANAGRIVWDTTTGTLKLDSGAAWKEYVDTNTTQTITGKTLSAASNTFTGVVLNSVYTAKGDILAATAASTPAVLAVGTDRFSLVANSNATNGIGYEDLSFANQLTNFSIEVDAPFATNTYVITYKDKLSNNLSTTNPSYVSFRSTTVAFGLYGVTAITSNLSLTLSSGSTLGQVSGQPSHIWVYLVNTGSGIKLAASHTKYAEDAVVTTVAEGGAGGADSATAIYSDAVYTSKPIRLIGYILNTQATAGTWLTFPTKIQLAPFIAQNSVTSQAFSSGSGTYITPAGCTRIRVRIIGGGGGGGGSGTADGTVGGTGGDTTFGSRTAGGGTGAVRLLITYGGGTSGSGGTVLHSFAGGRGGPGAVNPTIANGTQLQGGYGGQGFYGGGAVAGGPGGGGNAATALGGGGSGAGTDNVGTQQGGAGGGAGGFYEIIYNNPDASYSYSVGAAGAGGGAGTGGRTGGAGFTGAVHVYEEY